jgi:hypothetical protein
MKSKQFKISLIIVIITSLGILTIFFLTENMSCARAFFSTSTSLYFFSAFLQANAAILSIVGLFIIFKIQSLQSLIDIIEFANSDLKEKQKKYAKISYDKYTMKKLSEWIEKENRIIDIKDMIKIPTILLSIGIITSGIGLIFSNFLHNSSFQYEASVLYSFLLYEIFTLYFVIKIIFKISYT